MLPLWTSIFLLCTIVPPVNLVQNSCSETKCRNGYICKITHNQPQCIPEHQSCNTMQCPEGKVCEMVDGLPKCVPYPPSCHQVQCQEGTICDTSDGFPKCVPTPRTCAAVQCKEGTTCVITNNWPKCVPAPISCQTTQCNPGTTCKLINSLPQCVSTQLSCSEVQCKAGSACKIIHGHAKCVPLAASCGTILCEKGTICEMVGGHPNCVPLPSSCLFVECKIGTVCNIVDGWPKCIPNPVPLSCDQIHCKQGAVCEILNGKPVCVPILPSCRTIHCKEGTICEIIDDVPKCVSAIASCDRIQCATGTICEMENEWPKCVPSPRSCEKFECKLGTVCNIVNGWPTCIPGSRTSCTSISCKEETVCEMINGTPKCIPRPRSCEQFKCREGTMCEILNGWPTCVPLPSSCQEVQCAQGTNCKIVDGWPKCVSIPSTCDKLKCNVGTICKIVDGQPKCVSVPPSCENTYCALGTVCKIVEGWPTCHPVPSSCENFSCSIGTKCEIYAGRPKCIPVSPSCDNFQCTEGTVCKISNGWPKCVPIHTLVSCEKVNCNVGTKCEIYNDQATCIPISPTCDKFHCKAGTVCQISNGWPKCISIPIPIPAPTSALTPASCERVTCNVGTVCEMYNGKPTCMIVSPSCDKFHCSAGKICQISNGWPRCVPIPLPVSAPNPIPASCEKVICSPGTKCEIYNGQPKCLPISPSCDKFHCNVGKVCQIKNGWPQCVALPIHPPPPAPAPAPALTPIHPSCAMATCSVGTKCEIYDGQPKCLPISPSCDKFHCSVGTVCQIKNGWPQCVPVPIHHPAPAPAPAPVLIPAPIPPSCAMATCTPGTKCEIYGGQPKCLPISPSCDKFHCNVGTVCQIKNGWPRCVPLPIHPPAPLPVPAPIPIPPSCAMATCTVGTKCEIYGGQPKCIPISPSCDKFHCDVGTVCQIKNGWPQCVPVPIPVSVRFLAHNLDLAPASCERATCHVGTKCEIYEGKPECLPISPSCDQIQCEVGTICHIFSGWPQCVPIPSSCGNVTCNIGTSCQMVSGWSRCVPTPNNLIPSCDNLHCKEGTICEIVGSVPTCVLIPSSCDSIHCQQGTACQNVHGRPTCVSESSPESCASVLCSVGTVCQLVSGSPQCVPIPPSCEQFHCNPGTVCKLENGQPQCVPIPVSCETIHCQNGTACQVVNGTPKCVPTAQSCHAIQCMEGTSCKIVDGSPKCVPGLPIQPMCWASGQPHYHTFDGRSYDFQGTCTYTVIKTCTASSGLPFFHIFTKSQKSSPLSLISQVTITVYNYNISMVKNEYGLVRVNQLRSRLPLTLHDGKLSLYHRGEQLVIETHFGLKVYYDWKYYLAVKVTPAFQNHICGLCGNYNGNPNDDFTTSLGSLTTNTVEFGKSWKVEDGDHACSHGCHSKCRRCTPEMVSRYNAETLCGQITKHTGGPFRPCHAVIDPKPYLNDCVIDLCTFDGYKQILCRALKTYADACQREGVKIADWRKHTGCTIICPDHSEYMSCGSACPATCTDLDAPKNCKLPCVETCQCKPGFVLDSGKCISKDRCGCVYHGQLYAPNERFWGDNQCHYQCMCRAQDKKVFCHESRCKETEACHVVNGMRKCHPTFYGTCTALGQLHHITFDGLRYDVYGTCVYRLSELCHHSKANLTHFQVLVQNERQGLKNPLASKVIEIKVYGVTVTVNKNQVLLNGLLINLPYNIEYDKVSLYRHGWDIVTTTDFGLYVTFDGKNNIRITVPGTYRSHLCGLCGNFNAKADDDMLQPNGVLATNPADFGRSWKFRDIPGCTEKEKNACPDFQNMEHTQRTSKECGILLEKQGPFRRCYSKVPPELYFRDCVFDYCSNKGNTSVICHILSSYAAACQAAGAMVDEWRSAHLCKPNCSANSHYKVCASSCPVTCRSLFNPVLCTTKCHEGCECDEGFVLSGNQCVPISQCGCVHQGFYYKAGETFYLNGFCKEQCVCQVGGIMKCHRSSCSPNEECRLVNGVHKCQGLGSKGSGTCHVAGDPHYITFDGTTFDLQSNCSYILAKSCTFKSSYPAFSVNVENERRSNGKVSVTKVVSVIAHQNTISVFREKRGIILVNGAITFLPFRLEGDGMWAFYHGDNIVVQTDFGLFVSFDQLYHLIVKVPNTYYGQMCGLCGNYNGRPRDDLFLPSGQPSTSISHFATSWKVGGVQAVCKEDCASSICGPCHVSQKSSYVHTSQCSILQAENGPFSACYSTINPAVFYNHCVHDLCKARGNTVILCRAIHGYVTACQAAGIQIQPWRTAKFCPMKCPANSHYELCTRACPSRCKEVTSITKCPNLCAEGCQCNKGYFLAGYHCAPLSQCRCFHKGMWFKVGVKVITPNCMEECICPTQGRVSCKPLPCAAGESCALNNSKWSCVRKEGHCTIAQGNIFTSYDRVTGKIPVEGSYEISMLNDAKSPSWFRVVVQLHKCPQCPTPSVVSITVYFHKFVVQVKQDNTVLVNGKPVQLPAQPSKELSLVMVQDVVKVTYGSDVQVLYSSKGELTIVISGTLANKVSRSCGNFNGHGSDDLRLPDGRVAHTITEVISQWKVTTATENDQSKIHAY